MAETSRPDDATLVVAIRGGDSAAWGTVFDLHREAVWRTALAITRRHSDAEDVLSATFLRAVESIDQLQSPERLRPWLLSIARRRALDTLRPSRRKETPSEEVGLYEPSVDAGDAIAGLHLDDQRALVAAALEGLEHRDRVALEFAEAQDLVGQDLADALDISRDSAYALVHNARDRFAAAVATLLVSRHGRDRCPELDGLLGSWDGRLTPRLRKRINRHVEACDTCHETRSARVTPAALLGAAPIGVGVTVFDRVRGETLSGMGGTTPATVAASKFTAGGLPLGMIAGTVIAGVLAAGVVLGLTTYRGSGDRPTDPASLEDAATATVMPTAAPASSTAPATTAALTTTTTAPVDPCPAVDELRTFGAAGPATPSGEAFTAYLAGVKERLDAVTSILGGEASTTLLAYQTQYDVLVASGIDNPAAVPNDAELAALKDLVEAELQRLCP